MSQEDKWRLKDIIDLEVFFAEDQGREEALLAERDRDLFAREVQPFLGQDASSRKKKLKLWLEARRRRSGGADQTAGEYHRQALDSLLFLLAVAGGIVGAGVASAHLYYYVGRPINVMVFFTVTVLSQVLWLVFFGLGFLLRGQLRTFRGFVFIPWLVERMFLFIAQTREKALDRLGGAKRLRAQAVWGEIRSRQSIYGKLWLWPLLILTQTFAISLNLGILAMLLFLITFTNRAFGWETTLQLGPDVLYRIVEIIAWPWSWFAPHAHPTLPQVVASRIALIGPGEYPIDALVSWWPFLCYAVVFYGLLPRVALLVWASWRQTQTLKALPLDHSECNQVLRRMEPLVVASPPGPPLELDTSALVTDQPPQANGKQCVVIVSRDLELPPPFLDQFLQHQHCTVCEQIAADIYCDASRQPWFSSLASLHWDQGQLKLVVIIDASRPPIVAVRSFLKQLRASIGPRAEIAVPLFLKDKQRGPYGEIWEHFLRALGDPYLSVEREVSHD